MTIILATLLAMLTTTMLTETGVAIAQKVFAPSAMVILFESLPVLSGVVNAAASDDLPFEMMMMMMMISCGCAPKVVQLHVHPLLTSFPLIDDEAR